VRQQEADSRGALLQQQAAAKAKAQRAAQQDTQVGLADGRHLRMYQTVSDTLFHIYTPMYCWQTMQPQLTHNTRYWMLLAPCLQALQWQLLQQEDQQQQAAVSRASCLRQIRAAGAAAVHRRQQVAGAVARQTNLFR
jgi:hypothetical protein